MSGRVRRWLTGVAVMLALLAVSLLGVPILRDLQGDGATGVTTSAAPTDAAQVARGAYLARVGHCAGCHTAPGGAPYAGGRGIDTPFGTAYASNLTPDDATGLGRWSAQDFWQALHHGRSRDGRLLNPAFPYPNTTLVRREDADAIYAYLRTLTPVKQPNTGHALRWPYDSQLALAVWRRLYFEPGTFEPRPDQSAEWNRGSYLVNGLGHCAACHGARDALGGPRRDDWSGSTVALQGWFAPSLHRADAAGVQAWPLAEVVALLKTGVSPQAGVQGPMAEVVFGSTQHLSEADVQAMAVYLRSLPVHPSAHPPAQASPVAAEAAQMRLGAQVYREHCARCHGEQGEGALQAYPALAGNRAVLAPEPQNLLRTLLLGGYLPATAGHPRPYGMPPFGPVLSDAELAAVSTFLRQSWGHHAAPVTALQVQRAR